MAGSKRIIKGEHARAVQAAPFNAADTLVETQRRIAAAQAEIEQFQKQARAQAQALLTQARNEGYQGGYQEGFQKATAEVQARHQAALAAEVEKRLTALTPALTELVARLTEAHDQWTGYWDQTATKLACAIAERIVRHEIGPPGELIQKTLAELLALVSGCPNLTIFLNPADAETLNLVGANFRALLRPIGNVRIVPDESIAVGGCRLESEFGAIDAQIQTQLARIEVELTGKAGAAGHVSTE